jgi:hypothetical protein
MYLMVRFSIIMDMERLGRWLALSWKGKAWVGVSLDSSCHYSPHITSCINCLSGA